MHDQTSFQTDGKKQVRVIGGHDTRIHNHFYQKCQRDRPQWLNVKEKGELEVAEGRE